MQLLKYIPRLMLLPTTLATITGLLRGLVPSFVIWILVGATLLWVLLIATSPGLRADLIKLLYKIRDGLNNLQARLFGAVIGQDKTQNLAIKERLLAVAQQAEEAKLQGNESGYLTLRLAGRCMGRARTALKKKARQAVKMYLLAADYHQKDYLCMEQAEKANYKGERQMKWLWQSASHNWGNAAQYQAKVALAYEENVDAESVQQQKRVIKFKRAAEYYEQAARAFAKDQLQLAASLEEKAEAAANLAKRLDK